MRYNCGVTSLTEAEAFSRLRQAARRIDAALIVDRGSVHWIDGPYPGVSYGLALGEAHALLFLPGADIAEAGWEQRLPQRLEAAHSYLRGFTHPVR
jgi:hypothetical protein